MLCQSLTRILLMGCAVSVCGAQTPSPTAQADFGALHLAPLAQQAQAIQESQQSQREFLRILPGTPPKLEIPKEFLEKPFLSSVTLIRGTGEKGLYSSIPWERRVMLWYFRLAGEKLHLVQKNTLFRAEEGSPEERTLQQSFSDSILTVAPQAKDVEEKKEGEEKAAEEEPEKEAGPSEAAETTLDPETSSEDQAYRVEIGEIFLKDLINLQAQLQTAYPWSSFQLDSEASYIEEVKSFDKNIEIRSHLVFSSSRESDSVALPDSRNISLVVQFSLSQLPQDPSFRSRPADERVGHFLHFYQDLSAPELQARLEPYAYSIGRWHLEKKVPGEALSEAADPIEVWIQDNIPERFRGPIRNGILAWNAAFEAIGLKNAIVIREVAELPEEERIRFDPADAGYDIVVSWFTGVGADAAFAQGPMRIVPFTGQIYNAAVFFSDALVRVVAPREKLAPQPAPTSAAGFSETDFLEQAISQAAFALSVLKARGDLAPEDEKKFVEEWVTFVAAHEFGHTLGLRHNFKASLYPAEGYISNSVMDYLPPRFAAPQSPQGSFWQTQVGPYDRFAIEYAYRPLQGQTPEERKKELAAIAYRSFANPTLLYGTDEDADGADPEAARWDLGADPVAFAESRFRLAAELLRRIEEKEPTPEEGYASVRRDFELALFEYRRALNPILRWVGGTLTSRDRPQKVPERLPLEPASATRQREVLEFLARNVFETQAFELPAGLLRRLGQERLGTLEEPYPAGSPYPLAEWLLSFQKTALRQLLSPNTLAQIQRNQLLSDHPRWALGPEEIFDSTEKAIWSDLDLKRSSLSISLFERNLQREHVNTLIALYGSSAPSDALALARESLSRLDEKIEKALKNSRPDRTTRAHLVELQNLIRKALEGDARPQGSGLVLRPL
ncbi:MAG: zinc-dependent metalloprotease [Elusimicrobia bacterium]|nr:zinc-dependent metalloprotease [Elusimicrobiota bacterium]